MNLNVLEGFATNTINKGFLTGSEQAEKIIQVLDLFGFLELYPGEIKIINSEHTINVVEDHGLTKGIYFCDLLLNTRYSFDRLFYDAYELSILRQRLKINELWFVIVEENFRRPDLIESEDFINTNKVDKLYDKIFHMDLSGQVLKTLK